MQDFEKLINYISNRINENPYESIWINDRGERITADVGYAYDWWFTCMRPELLRKFCGVERITHEY